LNAEELVHGAAGVFQATVGIGRKKHFAAAEHIELLRRRNIADVFEVRDGVEPAGASGMARDEREFAVARAGSAPLEEVLELHRLIVLIDAKEADIEVVAGELEIVGIAAEEGDVFFGGEDEADVGVFFILVEMIFAALKERDDVAAKLGLFELVFFDRIDDGAAGFLSIGSGLAGLDRGIHLGGDVFNVHEDIELEIDALDFFSGRFGVKAELEQIAVGGAEFLEGVGGDVVIGHYQAAGRDEGARAAAIEADAGKAKVLEPFVGGLEAEFFLEELFGNLVEEPHALFGGQVGRKRRQRHEENRG
jgi:hypothetical protein